MSSNSRLRTVKLGRNGPEVTALGFGAMGLSFGLGTVGTDEERFVILDRAFELGCRFFDSADVYGDNEDLLGKWMKLRGNRKDIFLASKFSARVTPTGMTFTSTPEYCLEACEESLKRLGVDYIDLYYCHRVDKVTPIEKTIGAMVQLKNQGKIKHLGVSECSADTIRRAHAISPLSAVQTEYSPFSTLIEQDSIGVLKAAQELGIAIVAYSPLGKGFLTGQYRSPDDFEEGDYRKTSPRFSKENFPKNLLLVDQIKAIADKHNCTPGQLTMAWLMSQSTEGCPIIPIPGTKKIKYLNENMGALDVSLTEADLLEIRKLVDSISASVSGPRYVGVAAEHALASTPALDA